jgi:hypothetical protein
MRIRLRKRRRGFFRSYVDLIVLIVAGIGLLLMAFLFTACCSGPVASGETGGMDDAARSLEWGWSAGRSVAGWCFGG